LCGDDVHQRAALHAGEDRLVDLFGDLFVVGEDEAAARATQSFVRGRRDDVRVRERARVRAADDEACDVSDVAHDQRANLVGDRAEAGEVDGAWVGRV